MLVLEISISTWNTYFCNWLGARLVFTTYEERIAMDEEYDIIVLGRPLITETTID